MIFITEAKMELKRLSMPIKSHQNPITAFLQLQPEIRVKMQKLCPLFSVLQGGCKQSNIRKAI